MKRLKITISLLLILSFLMSAMPTLAADAGEITTESIVEEPLISEETTVTESTPEVEATILREEESLRGKYEKHFLMSDGTYQAVVYNEPIHYETATGWVEVDNTLTLQTAADGTAQYTTADGVTDVTFSRSFDEQLVTMRQDNYSLAWGVQAVSNAVTPILSTAEAELVTADLNTFTAEEQKTMAAKSSSTIQYRNALAQDVDLEYIVLPSRVKENIILNSAQNIAGYVVTVYTENITARLLENREIEFVNADGEVIFTMTSPYMYDSAGELSEEIEVELIDRGDVCYIFMTPNANWLNDASRVYPITIDPQVTTSSDAQNIIDNYVMENSGVQTYTLDRLYIGRKNGSLTRAYVKFSTMPTIPSGSVITSAQMTLWLTTGQSTGCNASAFMVTGGDWSSSTISWGNMPAANTLLQHNISHNSLTKYAFSCITAVKHWYTSMPNGKYQNYGIMLRYYNEGENDYNPVYSADYATASKRPSLTINYQSTPTEVAISEGSTFTFTIDSSSAVTWSSSNSNVATVTSAGVATGLKPGKTTITATANGTTLHTTTLYVKLKDGVYRIKNNAANYYLGTSGSIAERTYTQLVFKTSADPAQLYQLWKITYLDTGYYSIRPLYKPDMALFTNLDHATLYTTGTSDSIDNLSATAHWLINSDSLGYTIQYRASSGLVMAPNDDVLSNGVPVMVDTYSSTNAARHWTLERVSNPPIGVLVYDTSTGKEMGFGSRYLVVGTQKTLAELNIAAYAYSGNSAATERITWSCTSGSSHISINANTGTITALSVGTALVTGHSQYGDVRLYVTVTGNATTDFVLINQYDSSFLDDPNDPNDGPDLVGFIDDAVSFVNEQYQKQFGVTFSSSTDPYFRTEAITDACTNGKYDSCHSDTACSGGCNAAHHKNLYRISDHLYSSTIPQDHIVVFWTNRDFTSYCIDGKNVFGVLKAAVYACVYQSRPVIHIMTIDGNTNEMEACMAINLAHEIAHTLGLDEQYNKESHENSVWDCVMDRYGSTEDDENALIFYNQVKNSDLNLFCDSCAAQIAELLANDT